MLDPYPFDTSGISEPPANSLLICNMSVTSIAPFSFTFDHMFQVLTIFCISGYCLLVASEYIMVLLLHGFDVLQVWVPSRLCGAALWAGLQRLSGEQVPARCRMCGRHQRLHLCLQGGLQVSSQTPRRIREVTGADLHICCCTTADSDALIVPTRVRHFIEGLWVVGVTYTLPSLISFFNLHSQNQTSFSLKLNGSYIWNVSNRSGFDTHTMQNSRPTLEKYTR